MPQRTFNFTGRVDLTSNNYLETVMLTDTEGGIVFTDKIKELDNTGIVYVTLDCKKYLIWETIHLDTISNIIPGKTLTFTMPKQAPDDCKFRISVYTANQQSKLTGRYIGRTPTTPGETETEEFDIKFEDLIQPQWMSNEESENGPTWKIDVCNFDNSEASQLYYNRKLKNHILLNHINRTELNTLLIIPNVIQQIAESLHKDIEFSNIYSDFDGDYDEGFDEAIKPEFVVANGNQREKWWIMLSRLSGMRQRTDDFVIFHKDLCDKAIKTVIKRAHQQYPQFLAEDVANLFRKYGGSN